MLSQIGGTSNCSGNDCLAFVASQQVDLIELLSEKIERFEQKILEHAQLEPAYVCLLTINN